MSFTIFYDWVAEIEGLSLSEKIVFCVLIRFQGKNEESWASQDKIAKVTGIKRETVNRNLKSLQALGFISTKVFGHGKTNRYKCLKTESTCDKKSYDKKSLHDVTNSHTDLCVKVTQPVTNSHSLVIDQEKTNQPTSENRSVGRVLGVKEEIDRRVSGYKFLETDEGPLKRIERSYAKEQWEPILAEVIDDWLVQDIGSIPRILSFRLNKLYDKS